MQGMQVQRKRSLGMTQHESIMKLTRFLVIHLACDLNRSGSTNRDLPVASLKQSTLPVLLVCEARSWCCNP